MGSNISAPSTGLKQATDISLNSETCFLSSVCKTTLKHWSILHLDNLASCNRTWVHAIQHSRLRASCSLFPLYPPERGEIWAVSPLVLPPISLLSPAAAHRSLLIARVPPAAAAASCSQIVLPIYGPHVVVRILQAIWAGVVSNSTIKLHQTTCEPLTGAQYVSLPGPLPQPPPSK